MTKKHVLSTSMTKIEHLSGWLMLAARTWLLPSVFSAVLLILFPDAGKTDLQITLFFANFLIVLVLFRKFLIASAQTFSGKWVSALWKTGVALLVCKAGGIALNHLLYTLYPQYFLPTETGPALMNINDMSIALMAQEQFIPMVIGTVLFVPVVEELLYRGAVFGSIYPKSPLLAGLVCILLFAALHTLPYLSMPDKTYLVILFLQYVLPALCLCWLYTATDTIFAPILMHILFNALGVLAMR